MCPAVRPGRDDTSPVTEPADLLPHERDPFGRRRLARRELRVETAFAALFAVVAVAMLTQADGWSEPLSALLLTVTYAVVARVSFVIGPGQVSPTQLVFVPMLFLLPPEAVPALVAAGLLLAALPEIVLRRAHPERALVALAGSWYAVGPAAVFALVDPGSPAWEDVGIYALALGSQFAIDFVVSTLRERLGSGIAVRELAPVLAVVYFVDLMLSPIGFMAVLASEEHPYAYLLAVPPGALLALFAYERRRQVENELSLGRAYRRVTEELRGARLRVGEAVASTADREGIERLLLTTAVEVAEADCGVLADRLSAGDVDSFGEVLGAAAAAVRAVPAPQEVTMGEASALAIPLGDGDILAVARADRTFSSAEAELLEHLSAHVRVSLENLRLRESERAAAEAVRELSTPVLAVRERLLIVPLVGALDADRARQIVHTVKACGLLGAGVIVTGLSGETTRALVASGVDLRGIHAVADLQRGIEEAERLL
jgi:anti-anti-sigma regulatory factor